VPILGKHASVQAGKQWDRVGIIGELHLAGTVVGAPEHRGHLDEPLAPPRRLGQGLLGAHDLNGT